MAKSENAKKMSIQKSKDKKFQLKELDEPNLYKEIFPYTEVSKIVFDNIVVPQQPAKEIFITDTTFRDGQQSRPPYTAEQIVVIFQMLSKLGGPNGVIRQSEFFLYSKKKLFVFLILSIHIYAKFPLPLFPDNQYPQIYVILQHKHGLV